MIQPNAACIGFCNWMLNISAQHLSGPQRVIVNEVYVAAVTSVPVSNQVWYNFNLFTAWRNRFYRVYFDYATFTDPSLNVSVINAYDFEGNSTDLVGGNNGTDTAMVYGTPYGRILQGALFNGITSSIAVTPIITVGAFTFNMWLKTPIVAVAAYTPLLVGSISHGVYLRGTTNMFNFYNGADNFTSEIMPVNQWTMLTLSSDGTNCKVYINGLQVTITLLASGLSGWRYFGWDGGTAFFNGTMDAPTFWSVQLTQANVTSLYNAGSGLQYPF